MWYNIIKTTERVYLLVYIYLFKDSEYSLVRKLDTKDEFQIEETVIDVMKQYKFTSNYITTNWTGLYMRYEFGIPDTAIIASAHMISPKGSVIKNN